MSSRLKNEAMLALILIALGLFVLPAGIYVVGERIVGPYEGENGLLGLAEAVWAGLARGHFVTWLLVLSPYVVIQLLRLGLKLMRARIPVKRVTD